MSVSYVFAPKYRREEIYGKLKGDIGLLYFWGSRQIFIINSFHRDLYYEIYPVNTYFTICIQCNVL